METAVFILITYQKSLLIFLPEEIERAKRRGQTVIRKRLYAGKDLNDLFQNSMKEDTHA